jgi:hypothetical protein
LRDAELASERLSAVFRVVIFVSLLAFVMTTKVDHHHEHFALFMVAAYGVVARWLSRLPGDAFSVRPCRMPT